MTTFVITQNGSFVRRVDGNSSELLADGIFRSVNSFSTADQVALGFFPLALVAQPTFDTETQTCVDSDTQLINGNWTQVWSITNKPLNELLAGFQTKIQKRLDDFAKTRNYDDILSGASYAISSHPQFAAEGRYCADARDATWGTCYTLLGQVQEGTLVLTDWATLEALLPVLVWPA